MNRELLARLPQVEKVLGWPEIESLLELHSRAGILRAVRCAIDELRAAILAGDIDAAGAGDALAAREIVRRIQELLRESKRSAYRRVINGTGILLHTGLGRAVLPAPALASVQENLAGYSIVEVDVETGERNEREAPLRELLAELTGAESATIVNNNAAATLIILAAFARGREVIISRGQLVEIGGSFRIPDILAESGARLVEVGTTNRTYIDDYRRAITPETALLLAVHTSNYEIRGFSCSTPLGELVRLGKERGIPVVSDLGSGCFVDVTQFGFRREPLVAESVAAGADLVCFSGDKLLGGPQAGIIVGSDAAIARVRKHPLFRCVRPDKVTLTLLEATLGLYRDPEAVLREVPAIRALQAPVSAIKSRIERFIQSLRSITSSRLELEIVESSAEMGSGSLPAQEIASQALALRHGHSSPEQLSDALRKADPSVFTRIREDRVLIDFRTVLPEDEPPLASLIAEIAGRRELGESEHRERLTEAPDRMTWQLKK